MTEVTAFVSTSFRTIKAWTGGRDSLKDVSSSIGNGILIDSGCVNAQLLIGKKTLDALDPALKKKYMGNLLPNSGVKYVFGGGSAPTLYTTEWTVEFETVNGTLVRRRMLLDVVSGWVPFLMGTASQAELGVVPSAFHECLLWFSPKGTGERIPNSWQNHSSVLPLDCKLANARRISRKDKRAMDLGHVQVFAGKRTMTIEPSTPGSEKPAAQGELGPTAAGAASSKCNIDSTLSPIKEEIRDESSDGGSAESAPKPKRRKQSKLTDKQNDRSEQKKPKCLRLATRGRVISTTQYGAPRCRRVQSSTNANSVLRR